ncbi:DUF397 domain-containing protein [Streptomyces sp. NPDC046261]|uniref:DUF397 domain-containing protein n=1 Tax=Streptomyces sp. NPDC046261 TaxID=3157200 RepID=UPI0033D246F8
MSGELVWRKSSYSDDEGVACVEVAVSWRKSRHSDGEGAACVEVAASWRKSSHSDPQGSNCLEVATAPRAVHVRDSKRPHGPRIRFGTAAWAAFLTGTVTA